MLLEIREIISDLVNDLNSLDQQTLPNCRIDLDEHNFKVQGRAQPTPDGQIELTISLGFCFALDDALLSYLSNSDVFISTQDILAQLPENWIALS